jgi:hypothetical protein
MQSGKWYFSAAIGTLEAWLHALYILLCVLQHILKHWHSELSIQKPQHLPTHRAPIRISWEKVAVITLQYWCADGIRLPPFKYYTCTKKKSMEPVDEKADQPATRTVHCILSDSRTVDGWSSEFHTIVGKDDSPRDWAHGLEASCHFVLCIHTSALSWLSLLSPTMCIVLLPTSLHTSYNLSILMQCLARWKQSGRRFWNSTKWSFNNQVPMFLVTLWDSSFKPRHLISGFHRCGLLSCVQVSNPHTQIVHSSAPYQTTRASTNN